MNTIENIFNNLSIEKCNICNYNIRIKNKKFCFQCQNFMTNHFDNCTCIYCKLK